MHIENDCWEKIYPHVCIFEGYSFTNGDLNIYIHSGLTINDPEFEAKFNFRTEYGVGNCILVFNRVKRFEWNYHPYTKSSIGETIWGENTIAKAFQNISKETKFIALDGSSRKNGIASTYIEVEAMEFDIHILD
jgi:hypothetical protein